MQTSRSKLAFWTLLTAVVLIALDQISKQAAIAFLAPNTSTEFLGSVVKFYLIRNDAAAFSMGFGATWIFTIISSVATVVCVWFAFRIRTLPWALLLGGLLGGVAGNLLDRLFREPGFANGHVIDFIQIPFNFPIFNLADCAICVVAALTVIRVMRGDDVGGKRQATELASTEPTANEIASK